MNEFEKWYEEFTGVSIGYAEKTGMNSDVLKAAFKAGMLAAEEIADNVDPLGRDSYFIKEQIRQETKAKADEL